MTQVLELIQGEPLSLIVTLLLFAYVGNWAVGGNQSLRAWGWRLAFVAFVGYVAHAVSRDGFGDPGLLAAASFRALLAGGLLLGVSWIALSIIAFAYASTFGSVAATVRRWIRRQQGRGSERRQQEQNKSARRMQAEIEHDREQQMRQAAQIAKEAERRRIDARAAVLRAYSLYAPKIADRFTRAMFDEYLRDFMSDASLAEDVERHGVELLAIFETHVQEIDPPTSRTVLEELAQWLVEQRTRIEGLPLDDKLKRRLVAQLNIRYAELTSELLEELKP